jgi:large exoprotein involved in heme utilization and adhesion
VTDGSNIVINAGGSPLFLQSGTINATAGGKGNGGDVTINDVGATVVQGSRIIANASGGDGGAININLNKNSAFVEDTQSEISATSLTGNNGTVTINAPQTDLNSALHPAEVGVTQAPELSANACAPGTNRSTFVRDEHGGIAPAPDDYLTGQGPLLSAATQAWPTDFKPDAILPNLKQLVASADSGCR